MAERITLAGVNRKVLFLGSQIDGLRKDIKHTCSQMDCSHSELSVNLQGDGYISGAVCSSCGKCMRVENGFDRAFSVKRIYRYLRKPLLAYKT